MNETSEWVSERVSEWEKVVGPKMLEKRRQPANSEKNHETFTISKWHKIDDIFEKFSVFLPPNPIKCAFLPLAAVSMCSMCVPALSSASSSHSFSFEFNIIRFLFVGAVFRRIAVCGERISSAGWLGWLDRDFQKPIDSCASCRQRHFHLPFFSMTWLFWRFWVFPTYTHSTSLFISSYTLPHRHTFTHQCWTQERRQQQQRQS